MSDTGYTRRRFMGLLGASAAAAWVGPAVTGLAQNATGDGRPNILWIIVEDMSCHFGYQGERTVRTPHVDRLAAEGTVFSNAYISCPVCSPSRSALITGMYQTTIGAHQHRSSRGLIKHHLPAHVRLIPEMFKQAGYYTCNSAGLRWDRKGKTDYNFVYDQDLYDGADWSGRQPGQPFFAQVQLHGGKLRSGKTWPEPVRKAGLKLVTPDQVTLPPYYPDDAVIRNDWAAYLNTVQYTDYEVGRVLQRLRDEGLDRNTVVFFITDHGISHARGKQFLYDEGAKVPFIVWSPGRIGAGEVRDDPICHIDMAATSLDLAGIEIPTYMESRPLLGPNQRRRTFVVSARDRCDETVDRIRSVRKGSFKYIRNFYPKRPYLQPCAYKDKKTILRRLRALHAEGKLDPIQSLHLASERPNEELYDLRHDRWEIHNLADDPAHATTLAQMRGILEGWIEETNDQGQEPESAEMYDSDMKVYVDGQRRRDLAHARVIEKNIALMKRWRAEGR